jgi:hypothetical protein
MSEKKWLAPAPSPHLDSRRTSRHRRPWPGSLTSHGEDAAKGSEVSGNAEGQEKLRQLPSLPKTRSLQAGERRDQPRRLVLNLVQGQREVAR